MKSIWILMLMALLGASAYAAQPSDTMTMHDETSVAAVDTPIEHECDCLTSEACEVETMIPVDQTRLHDADRGAPGNCMQAALATILDLSIEQVPDFTAGVIATSGRALKAYWQRIDDFLAERGLYRVGLPEQGLPGLHLASGTSPRGVGHVVVRRGWDTIHDPHPSRAGLATVDRAWVLVPIDPARVRPPEIANLHADGCARA